MKRIISYALFVCLIMCSAIQINASVIRRLLNHRFTKGAFIGTAAAVGLRVAYLKVNEDNSFRKIPAGFCPKDWYKDLNLGYDVNTFAENMSQNVAIPQSWNYEVVGKHSRRYYPYADNKEIFIERLEQPNFLGGGRSGVRYRPQPGWAVRNNQADVGERFILHPPKAQS